MNNTTDMNNTITLYSNGCPKCKVLEAKLASKNINFDKSNDVNELINIGLQSFPALKVDGQIMPFFDANNWINEQPEI